MIQSKYLERFKRLQEAGKGILVGDRYTLEVLPKEEVKTSGGLYIESSLANVRSGTEENKPTLGIILEVGAGAVDENGEDVPPTYSVGEIVWVSTMGLKLLTSYPGLNDYAANTIAMTRESEIHKSWASVEAYEADRCLLNS